MNETLKVIDQRHSNRMFSDQPIDQSVKDQIFHAAFRAPTAGNMMLYSIIEVEDQELKQRLAVTCDDQPFIAKASLVLVFLADYQRWWDYYHLCGAPERATELNRPQRPPQMGDYLLACCDALVAAQNAVIAAESLGVQSCYIGDILERYEIHRQIFDLPKYVVPITMLCFGYPKRSSDTYPRVQRFAPEYIVSKNRYHHLDKNELNSMFAPFEEKMKRGAQPGNGAQNFGQHNYLRKFVAEFSFEMSRSVGEMIKSWQSD